MKSRSKGIYEAEARYCFDDKTITVKKGSRLNPDIFTSEKFDRTEKILSKREGATRNNILSKDIMFKTASEAAVFVSGKSVNGLQCWKDKDGVALGELDPQLKKKRKV